MKEGKGLVKEYFNGDLRFEGAYLNGERNGKGKEYDFNGKLIFEGEYLNGNKYNGKGYDPLNKVSYELKQGKGAKKEYTEEFIFEGEYLNGTRNGRGKEYDLFF